RRALARLPGRRRRRRAHARPQPARAYGRQLARPLRRSPLPESPRQRRALARLPGSRPRRRPLASQLRRRVLVRAPQRSPRPRRALARPLQRRPRRRSPRQGRALVRALAKQPQSAVADSPLPPAAAGITLKRQTPVSTGTTTQSGGESPTLRRFGFHCSASPPVIARCMHAALLARRTQRCNVTVALLHWLTATLPPIVPLMSESPVALLRAHARHAPWNVRGLAAHASSLVDAAGMRPTSSSARATPSARAIRYYVSNGLLNRPDGTGTTATYNYRHLLQLLAIKIRQREGHTLERIREEMDELTGDALERRVAQSLAPALMGSEFSDPSREEGSLA